MADKHIADGESAFRAVNSSPDACKVGDVVVPFDCFQVLSNKKQYSETVWARGFSVLNVGSVIAGTQSNAGKGVISGTSLGSGDCTILSGSPTVSVEGKAVALYGSLVGMNNMNCQGKLLTKQAPPNDVVKDNALPCNNPPVSSPRLEELMKSRQEVSNSLMESLRKSLDFSKGINSADEWTKEQIDKLRSVPLESGSGQMIYDMETGAEIPVDVYNAQNEINAGVVRGLLGFGRSLVSGIASLGNMLDQQLLEDPRVKPLEAMILAENIRLGNVCLEGIEKQISDTWDGIKAKASKEWDDFQNASAGDKAEIVTRALAEIATLPIPASEVGLLSKVGVAADLAKAAETTELVSDAGKIVNTAKATGEIANDLGKTADASETTSFLNKTDDIASKNKNDGPYVDENAQVNDGEGKTPDNASTCKGDPVDVGTGDLLQQLSVLTLPGALPLTLSRTYRSRPARVGLFGPKWVDEWSCSLQLQGKALHFTDPEGTVLYYPLPRNGVFNNARNSRQGYYRLFGDIRQTLTIVDQRRQLTMHFSPSASGCFLLSALHDRHNNQIDFIRADGLLVEIRRSDGYTLELGWERQQLMSIDLVTPQRQRLVTCNYDSNGFLAECDTFQFSHLWHEYTSEGWMTHWRDTDKTRFYIKYDVTGRVTETRTDEGYYCDRFIYDDEEKCTTYLDAEGGESRYWYNNDGLVIRTQDELGRESFARWDNTRLLSRTDALGRITKYIYNSNDEISQVSLPGGYSLYYDYNERGQLTRLSAPGNQVWQWAYDDKGSMVSLTDPQGRHQQFSYSEQGDLLARIMPNGAAWRWHHDALHRVQEATAPNGGVVQTEQDMLGRLLSVKDPLGYTTQFRHSKNHAGPQGSVEEINRPDGVRELMSQNGEKLPESFTDGEGKTTLYEYGAFDLLTAVVRPDGERLTCRYDKLTRLTEITNAEGGHYRLTYDNAGQLIAETDFTGRTLTYQYDAGGRCIRTTFPDGTHLNRRYNVTDQVTDEEVTQGNSDRVLSRTTFIYDELCRLTEARNDDATVTYEYDEASRITAETINGRRTEYRHDAELDTVAQRTTAGVTEYFTRGLMGELTSWRITGHAPLTFEYDLRGQETARKSEAGFYQRLDYTRTGMLAAQRAGSQAEPGVKNKDLQRQWGYDRAYNLTKISDSLRGTMVNSMTANDQIHQAAWADSGNALMQEERFTYDKNLNITRSQTWVNSVLESEAHQQQQHGRVVSREYKGWRHSAHRINPETGKAEEGRFVRIVRQDNTTWKYDANGRLTEKLVDKGGYRLLQWRYRWDARSQLTGLETPEGERWEYKYDPFGRRISKRCINRDRPGMDFHWNGNQLTEEIPVGPDNTPQVENVVRWMYEPGSFTPLARYEKGQLHYAVTDTVGRVQELLTEAGEIVWQGKQQLWGREESRNREGAPSCHLRFPGQYEDEESGLYYNRFRYYDCGTGQYLCADPTGLRGGLNPYGYVKNPLKYIDPLGLCKETGGRQVLNPESISGWEKAESMYDLIRFDPNDISLIAKNTGWKESIIARVKNHLFFKDHMLDRGLSRFDADPAIVNAWDRLKTGDYTASDINLLRHEQFESRFEGIFGTDYRVAHDAAERSGRVWE